MRVVMPPRRHPVKYKLGGSGGVDFLMKEGIMPEEKISTGMVSTSIYISTEQREELTKIAAKYTLATGERNSVSSIIYQLIEDFLLKNSSK